MGMAATNARPTKMCCASSGLCHSRITKVTAKIYAIGTRRLAASPATNTLVFCTIVFKCDVFTPRPALNISVASMIMRSDTWIFAWKIVTSPKLTFRIHKPTTGKTVAMA